jgi:hypothetical protein
LALAVRVVYGGGNGSNGGAFSLFKDGSVQDGDYLIAFFVIRNTDRTPAAPAGWTQQGSVAVTGGNDKMAMFYKRANGEPASESWNASGGTTDAGKQVEIVCLSGGTNGTFVDDGSTNFDGTSSASQGTANVTGADSTSFAVACVAQRGSSALTFTPGAPYTEDFDASVNGSFRMEICHHAIGAATENMSGNWSSNPGGVKLSSIIAVNAIAGVNYTDAQTIPLALTPSGVDVSNVSAATVPLVLKPSGIDAYSYQDIAEVVLLKIASGIAVTESFDAATVRLSLTPSGSDVGPVTDSAETYLDLQPSGTTVGPTADAATGLVRFTPATEIGEDTTILLKLVPSATVEEVHQCFPRFIAEISAWEDNGITKRWFGELERSRWDGELVVEAVVNHGC